MGQIQSVKTMKNGKVIVTLELSETELLWLQGNMQDMHLFSESNLMYRTKLVQRGKRESSKYFLMPKELRQNLVANKEVNCNKIETSSKTIYLFTVNKRPDLKSKFTSSRKKKEDFDNELMRMNMS